MPVKIHEVKGYDDYQDKFNHLKALKETLYVWYMGSRVDGQSWCGDCRDSEPVIQKCLDSLNLMPENINVVCVEIDREDLRSPDSKFRTDESINLMKIPTLFNPSLQRQLVERECMDTDKLVTFFSDHK